MKIFVTRHGQTNWNAEERIQGQQDIELNENGIEQAKMTSDSIKNEKIDLIICSPLKRARKTADIINEVLNVPVFEDKRLMERYFGKSEGLTKSEIREIAAVHPEIVDVWNYKRNVDYNGMETMQDFCKRIKEFLDELKEKYNDKTVLLVTHGGVFVPMNCFLSGILVENLIDRNSLKSLKNCEVAQFEA